MAKQSILERQKKRETLVLKYKEKRSKFRKDAFLAKSFQERQEVRKKLEKLPRDSARVRLKNRCWKTGRGRGIYKDFGLCRHTLREMAHNCLLPGLYKASW